MIDLILLGGTSLGLVWGWLAAWAIAASTRTSRTLLLWLAALLLMLGEAWWLAGARILLPLLSAVALAGWLHLTWRYELARKRNRH